MSSRGKGSYNDPAVAGGGQIYSQVSHAAAYLTFLTGLRPAEVFARFDRDGSPNDIYNALTVTLENGALVSLASTGATPPAERNYEVRIFGSQAILQLELWRGTMTLIDFAGKRTEFQSLQENEIYPSRSPALNFIDAILGQAANGSPGDLGLASMEIIEAACESAQTGRNVIIRAVRAGVGGLRKNPRLASRRIPLPAHEFARPTRRHRVGPQPRLAAVGRHRATLRGNPSGRPHPLAKTHPRRIRPRAD